MSQFDVDLVYLWVDGGDPKWVEKKKQCTGTLVDYSERNNKGRYIDNGELRYSLRSAEKYAPWVRRIYIVTDDQYPRWLKIDHPNIQVVDHTEILPKEALPCFNSRVIEGFLYKIQGLSEHFLYANDDMFFNAKATPEFFFTSQGMPIVRLKRTFGGKKINKWRKKLNVNANMYRKAISRAALLIEEKYGKYYAGIPHHNVDSYLKSDYQFVSEKLFRHEIHSTITNHLRSENDIQRSIYLYYALAVGRGKLRYVGRDESCRIRVHKPDHMRFVEKYRPAFFCLNDCKRATDADRRQIEPFLKNLFPKKSSFEL